MSKLIDFFKKGPPPPQVVLLPDHRFFMRVMPVVEGAMAADVESQVELALETLSPFPPAQLYHGYFWVPGATQVLVFASYRKRFAPELAGAWKQAEVVMPAFASLLAIEHEPSTALLFPSAEGLTLIHWNGGPVPAAVLTSPIAADATDEERFAARDALLRAAGGSRAIIDLMAPPEIAVTDDEKSYLFRAGETTARLPKGMTATADVRDKDELAAFRSEQKRDLLLWRVVAGCAAALVLLVCGELAIVGGRSIWLKAQNATIVAQQPLVNEVMTADSLATQIEDLVTKRMLPLEMLLAVGDPKIRGGILLTRIFAQNVNGNGLYTLELSGQTSNAADVEVYRLAIQKLPGVEALTTGKPSSSNGVTTFTFSVIFKPDALKPAA